MNVLPNGNVGEEGMPLTQEDQQTIERMIAEAVAREVQRQIEPLQQQIDDLKVGVKEDSRRASRAGREAKRTRGDLRDERERRP